MPALKKGVPVTSRKEDLPVTNRFAPGDYVFSLQIVTGAGLVSEPAVVKVTIVERET
jgi:hypothetical protein